METLIVKPKPFIPAWLDEAGLSPAEFRVLFHLIRSADNKTGVAWPSYRRMIEITGLSKSTIRRAIESLENPRGLIAKMGKPFGGSCRYKVLSIVSPQGQLSVSNSSTTDPFDAAPIVPPQTRNSPSDGTSIVPPQGQEGNPRKVIQRRLSKGASPEAIQFAVWFKGSLPQSTDLGKNWQQKFAQVYDDLVSIDKRQPEEIRKVCQWARTDSFWSSNILSPAKLRKRNGDGIKWYDVLLLKMNHQKQSTNHPTIDTSTRSRGPEETILS